MSLTRVVLVDDSATFMAVVARYLAQQEGIDLVGAATDGREVLHLARELHPDVVLVDQEMQGMNGLETIALLREALPAAGIGLLTLLPLEHYGKAARAAGADEVLAKSDLTMEVVPAIWRMTAVCHQRRSCAAAGA